MNQSIALHGGGRFRPVVSRFVSLPGVATPLVRQWTARLFPDAATKLLALADQYESTQPSYAADLRATAYRATESRA